MKQIKQCSSLATLMFLLFFTYGANASVTWDLNDFLFDDGTRATGSFEWDEGANTATSWNVLTVTGSRPGTVYSSSTGIFSFASNIDVIFFSEGSNQFRIGLTDMDLLNTPNAHLDSFSNVSATGSTGFLECTNCSNVRFGVSGAFLSSPSAVPVPAAVWLFASGLAGLFGVARRKAA